MGVKEAFEWHEGVCSKLAIFSTGRTRELQKLVFGSDVSFAKASRLGGMVGGPPEPRLTDTDLMYTCILVWRPPVSGRRMSEACIRLGWIR